MTGGLGEAVLLQPGGESVGTAVLLGAAVMAGVAWRCSGAAEEPALAALPHQERREVGLRLAGIAGALLLAGAALLAWAADPDAIFGLQGALWLASMGLLLAACARWYPPGADPGAGPPWTRGEAALFAGLVALALVTYCAGLDQIPWRYHADELTAYHEALRFYRGPPISLFTTTWFGTGLPSLPFALAGGMLRLAGAGLGGSRLAVALIGALTAIPLYGIGRLAWGRRVAALAAFAWATTPVAVQYSRSSVLNSTTAFAWAVCFYFLLRGLRSRRPGDFAWAGLAAGLSQYTYYGTRLLPFVLLVFGAYLALAHWRLFRACAGLLALLPMGFVAGFGPLLAYFGRHPEMWAGRGLAELVVPPAIPLTPGAWAADLRILAPLLRLDWLGLSVIPSHDADYWAPFLPPIEAVLLVLGAGVLVARWRQPAAFLLLLWGLGVVFVGGTLVTGSLVPAFVHWAPAFPALLLALALPPAGWLAALPPLPRLRHAGVALVAAGMLALAVANAYTYLVTYPATVPPAFESAQGRFLATLGPHDRVLFVGDSHPAFSPEGAQMLAPRVPARALLDPRGTLPLPPDPAHDLVFVFAPDELPYLSLVQTLYPGGHLGTIATPGGPIGATYRVPASR